MVAALRRRNPTVEIYNSHVQYSATVTPCITRCILLPPHQFSALEAGDKTVCRWPLTPAPRLGRDCRWIWHHEHWDQHETIVNRNSVGVHIAWQCPMISEGRITFRRSDRLSGRPCVAAMTSCVIQRLHTDLASLGLWHDEMRYHCDSADEILQEGYTGDRSIEEPYGDAIDHYIADWDARWGRTPFRFEKNPWVWRLGLRVLDRVTDGVSGRSRAGGNFARVTRAQTVRRRGKGIVGAARLRGKPVDL